MLSQAGVAPRMAQELLRHSDIRLTMNTYTHLQLVDTAGAVEALPEIDKPEREKNRQVRTGTYDGRGSEIGAEIGAVIGAERQEIGGIARQAVTKRHDRSPKIGRSETPVKRERNKPLSASDKGFQKAGDEIRSARRLRRQTHRISTRFARVYMR